MSQPNRNWEILDKFQKDLPPMTNEPNQDTIDAETARKLREAAQERRKSVDDIEKYLRG